ncbi:hypothetical protein MPER_03882 [Moniliophthora perniciosa FA553]|nr:hypothetical protein MPER_03882 [Moniliophthora perniciosa FA553]
MEDSQDLNSQTLNLSKGRADRRARFQVCATSTPRDPVSGNDVVRFLFQALPASFDIDDPDDSSFNVLLSITTIAQRLYSPESEVLAITKSLWTTICAQSSRLVQGFIISSEKRPTTAVGYLFRERLLATMVLLLCGLEHIASIHSVQEYRALLSLAPLFLP